MAIFHKRGSNLRGLTWQGKKRDRLEIIASMLEAVKYNEASRCFLMKHLGTNFVEIKKYLKSLTEMGFIETDIKDGRVLYKASEKGLDFLGLYYILLEKMSSTHV